MTPQDPTPRDPQDPAGQVPSAAAQPPSSGDSSGGSGEPERMAPVPDRQPDLVPPWEILQAYGARVLDPTDAVRITPQEVVYPTVYIGDQLLVAGGAPGPDWASL